MTLVLPRTIYDALRGHGEEAYPAESCGALLGRPRGEGWEIAAAVRATNATAGPTGSRYEIAPEELVRIAVEARRQGLEIAGFYHSHPDAEADWSASDLAGAHWLGASYVITAIERGTARQTRSFHLAGATEQDKSLEAEAIEIGEGLHSSV